LKLAAWKILKEKIPGIDSFPGTPGKKGKKGKGNEGNSMFIESSKKNFSSTGLTGPADPVFRAARALHAGGTRFGKLLDPEANAFDRANMPSVFDDGSDEEDHDDDDEEDEEDEEEDESRKVKIKRLEELDDKATATEVIKAWSLRLKEVYAQCSAVEENESNHSDEESELALQEDTPNVKLKRSPRKQQQQQRNSQIADRSDLLGEKDDHSVGSPKQHKKKAATTPVKPSLDHLKHYKSASAIQWDEVLSNFYLTMNMPNKVNGIPTILKTWSGKEEEMLHSLIEKYEKEGKDIPKKLNKYFQHIFSLLETQTDSSFRKSPKSSQKKRIEL
jgi:hypothetical protein